MGVCVCARAFVYVCSCPRFNLSLVSFPVFGVMRRFVLFRFISFGRTLGQGRVSCRFAMCAVSNRFAPEAFRFSSSVSFKMFHVQVVYIVTLNDLTVA